MATPITETLETKYPGMRERLGTVPDSRLAEEYGITRARVYQFRSALGIDPAVKTKPAERVETIRTKAFRLLLAECERRGLDLGVIAQRLSVTRSRLMQWVRGASGRQPSYDAIVVLAGLADREIVLRDEGIVVRNRSPIAGGRRSIVIRKEDDEDF